MIVDIKKLYKTAQKSFSIDRADIQNNWQAFTIAPIKTYVNDNAVPTNNTPQYV